MNSRFSAPLLSLASASSPSPSLTPDSSPFAARTTTTTTSTSTPTTSPETGGKKEKEEEEEEIHITGIGMAIPSPPNNRYTKTRTRLRDYGNPLNQAISNYMRKTLPFLFSSSYYDTAATTTATATAGGGYEERDNSQSFMTTTNLTSPSPSSSWSWSSPRANLRFPTRYTIYPPLLLLPEDTLTEKRSPGIDLLSEEQKRELYEEIVGAFAKKFGVRCLAIQGGIAQDVVVNNPMTDVTDADGGGCYHRGREVNRMRVPTGLVPLWGDFGLMTTGKRKVETDHREEGKGQCHGANMDDALWVTDRIDLSSPTSPAVADVFMDTDTSKPKSQTRQKRNVVTYTWAPLYTMYSHGNISEKRRISAGVSSYSLPILSASSSPAKPQNISSASPFPLSPPYTPPTPDRSNSKHNKSQPLLIDSSRRPIFNGLDTYSEEGEVDEEGGKSSLLGEPLQDIAVVDFFIGIGYFAFPYLRRGVGQVWGFDLNPWSTEACRRGAELNGISCQVLEIGDHHHHHRLDEAADTDELSQNEVQKILQPLDLAHHDDDGDVDNNNNTDNDNNHDKKEKRTMIPELVVFRGDNKFARTLLSNIKSSCSSSSSPSSTARKRKGDGRRRWKNVRHVNLGLLPTSRPAWKDAVWVLDHEKLGGWIHVHENVKTEDIGRLSGEIVESFQTLVDEKNRSRNDDGGGSGGADVEKGDDDKKEKREEGTGRGEEERRRRGEVSCVHVESVKTYAPGVWHVVFDIWIHPFSSPSKEDTGAS